MSDEKKCADERELWEALRDKGGEAAAPDVDAGKWASLKRMLTGSGSAGGQAPSTPSGSTHDLALRTIRGKFGVGAARKAALGSRYDEVQAEVNRILVGQQVSKPAPAPNIDDLARRTIAGEFGNGAERRNALGANYDAGQRRVNEILGGSAPAKPTADIGALADAVIRDDCGNGEDRRRRLGDLFDAVQAEVNRRLS